MEEYKSLKRLTRSINKACGSLSHTEQVEGKSDNLITLNIGGTKFTTLTSTAKSIPDSLLSQLDENSKYFNQSQQAYYFDRDANMFMDILNAHRDGEIHVPRDVCPIKFRKEIKFWGIPFWMLSPCCWKIFYEADNDLETLNDLALYTRVPMTKVNTSYPEHLTNISSSVAEKSEDSNISTAEDTQPSKLWLFLEEPASSTAAKVWFFSYIFVVLLSTAVYVFWLHPSARVDIYLSKMRFESFANVTLPYEANEKIIRMLFTDPHPVLFVLDAFCMIFFIVELILHFGACPRKREYCKDSNNVLKIVLTVAMLVSFGFEFRKDVLVDNMDICIVYFTFKSFNVLRLMLIHRLRKLYCGLQIMLLSLEKSFKELLLLALSFFITVTIYGCLIFVCEIESEMFSNTFESMWWALITMTTVGYGDFYPTQPAGYVFGAVCAINGLVVIALPIAAIASIFSDLYSRNADLEKHLAAIKQVEKGKKLNKTEKNEKSEKMENVMSIANLQDSEH